MNGGGLGKGFNGIPGRGVETKTSGSACYDSDFAFEGEDAFEILDLHLGFCFGCHLGSIEAGQDCR